jgi:hypothetical protein
MAVPVKARNHMPVQVRHHVAQRCNVDLGGLQILAQGLFNLCHHIHAMRSLRGVQVGKLGHMGVPDHAVKGGKTRLVGTDDAQPCTAPDERPAIFTAQRAVVCHTSTRSMPPLLARCTYSGSQFSPRICLAISITM